MTNTQRKIGVECATRGTLFLLGAERSFDAQAALTAAGWAPDNPGETQQDPELTQLFDIGPMLLLATEQLARAQVKSRQDNLPLIRAYQELEKTSDGDRLVAISQALDEAHLSAVKDPLEQAFVRVAGQPISGPLPTALQPGILRELLQSFSITAKKNAPRLAFSRMQQSPLPIKIWMAQLRPLIHQLLAPADGYIAVADQNGFHGPPVLCAQLPDQHCTVYSRDSLAMSVARSFASATGIGIANCCDLPQHKFVLATLLAAQLGNPQLWRRAGLSKTDAKDAARCAGLSLLRMLTRLVAYVSCGDNDVRAWAASACELLSEPEDLRSALRWRGPYPNPFGLPLPVGAQPVLDILGDCQRGITLSHQLIDSLGEDWFLAPEAGEQLLFFLDNPGQESEDLMERLLACQ